MASAAAVNKGIERRLQEISTKLDELIAQAEITPPPAPLIRGGRGTNVRVLQLLAYNDEKINLILQAVGIGSFGALPFVSDGCAAPGTTIGDPGITRSPFVARGALKS